MSVEVELKARLRDPHATVERLGALATPEASTYRDTYYDFPDHRLEQAGRQELRLRVITTATGTRAVWTFKGTMLDEASTPEYETTVGDAATAHEILTRLGLAPVIAYTKNCRNFRFSIDGRDFLATVIEIPELADTFLELETIIPDDGDIDAATDSVRTIVVNLDLNTADLEPTFYVDLVQRARAQGTK